MEPPGHHVQKPSRKKPIWRAGGQADRGVRQKDRHGDFTMQPGLTAAPSLGFLVPRAHEPTKPCSCLRAGFLPHVYESPTLTPQSWLNAGLWEAAERWTDAGPPGAMLRRQPSDGQVPAPLTSWSTNRTRPSPATGWGHLAHSANELGEAMRVISAPGHLTGGTTASQGLPSLPAQWRATLQMTTASVRLQ